MANGAGGRPRKPTSIKKAEGNRSKAKFPENEPEPEPGPPLMPEDLGAVGQKEWHRICKDLEALGVLAQTDGKALEEYARLCEEFETCHRKIKADGLTFFNGAGGISPHPLLAHKLKLHQATLRCLTEFGLTPSSRSKVSVIKKQKSTLEKFLKSA